MRKSFAFVLAAALLCPAGPALADFLAVEVDAQAGYAWFDKIQPYEGNQTTRLEGGVFGVHGKLEILFISLMVDYQHFINNADLLHVGLGADFKLDLSVVAPFVRGSAGMIMFCADGGAFDPAADDDYPSTLGFQARAGAGLEIPLGDWFAVGAAADVGIHYLDEVGYDLAVTGYLGLRI